uniref:Uncharacterized protein n=1 Tax=Arundo donax TaxID=35708 RepID=A0A0A8Y1U9_ARUDO
MHLLAHMHMLNQSIMCILGNLSISCFHNCFHKYGMTTCS